MSEPFIGQLSLFAFGFAPKNWLVCQGQMLPISQYQALFSLLGTTYGGDGRTNFGVPDLRGRTSVSSGIAPNLGNYVLGAQGGEESHNLTISEVPPHNHMINVVTQASGASKPGTNLLAATSGNFTPYAQGAPLNSAMGAGTIAAAGGGTGHENRQPYLVLNWCMALTGIFPSRT